MRLFLCLLFLLPVFTHAQRSYKPEEINRLADLGRLWGILHYFHPAMADGSITTESLVVDNAASLANDPSAENFKRVVADMLGKLKDPFTRIVTGPANTPVTYNIFSSHPDSVTVHHLDNGVVYVACPTAAVKNAKTFQNDELSVTELSKSKGIVFDFRNRNSQDDVYDEDFIDIFVSEYLGSIVDEQEINPVYQAFIEHNGFVPQNFTYNVSYTSGWKFESNNMLYKADFVAAKLKMPIVFVVNTATSIPLLRVLQAIQYTGKAFIVYEGNAENYPNHLSYQLTLADSIRVVFKAGYCTIGNNYLLPPPDKITAGISDSNNFMNMCGNFLVSYKREDQKKQLDIQYKLPRLSNKPLYFVPVGERLLGLYNYWNAIHYFHPSRNLIDRDWNSVLYEYIPAFINVTDTFNYYSRIQNLISEINDSHAGVGFIGDFNIFIKKYYYTPPLVTYKIEDRLFVIHIKKDTLQDLSQVHTWDEIIKINGMPVKQYVTRLKKLYSASNEENFYHMMYRYLILSGGENTTVAVTFKRGLKEFEVQLKRTARGTFYLPDTLVNLPPRYPDSKMLPNNIGYINMGKITIDEVDDIMKSLWETKALIFDIRNRPKNTAWAFSAYLTPAVVATHMNRMMSVNYTSIEEKGESNFSKANYTYVTPRKDKRVYKGRVIILCDNKTESHSEYSVMHLAVAGKGTVIGSQTVGADGDMSDVIFPGGYYSAFSALGVHYPDGTITQRTGVKIDIEIKPTLEGLKAGRDEVLERAIRFINTGK